MNKFFSPQQDMSVAQAPAITPADPTDPPSKAKVAEYLKGLYAKTGARYNESRLEKITLIQDKDRLRTYIDQAHQQNNMPVLDDSAYESLYLSFNDTAEDQKKKESMQAANAIQDSVPTTLPGATVLPSISEEDDTSSESSQEDSVVLDYYQAELDKFNILPALRSVGFDFLSQNEEDAMIEFNSKFKPFGFEAKVSNVGKNELEITRPDGTIFNQKLTSGLGYLMGDALMTQEKIDLRTGELHKEFVTNMNTPGAFLIPAISKYLNMNPESADEIIQVYTSRLSAPLANDLDNLAKTIYPDGAGAQMFFTDGEFDSRKYELALDEIINLSTPEQENFDNHVQTIISQRGMDLRAGVQTSVRPNMEILQFRNEAIELKNKHEEQKRRSSRLIAHAIGASDLVSSIDLSDQEAVNGLEGLGIHRYDLPLPSLKINGRQASYQDVYDLITRPVELRAVRDGRINIEINPDADSGVLNPLVERLQKIQSRNSAFFDPNNPVYNEFERQLGDVPQGIFASMTNMTHVWGVGASDALQAIGISEEAANNWVFTSYGVDVEGARSYNPFKGNFPSVGIVDKFTDMTAEYDWSLSDARDAGEMFALGIDAFTHSSVYTALFLLNPTLGLGGTFFGTYGQTIEDLKEGRKEAKDLQSRGVQLSPEQDALAQMSDWVIRGVAGSKATTETLITRAFTYNYYANLKQLQKLKDVPKTVQNAEELAKAYNKHFKPGLVREIARQTGVDAEAIGLELVEEPLIAYTQYGIEVAWGMKEYDSQVAGKLALDAGLASLFTSLPMGMGKRVFTRQIPDVANQTIKGRIVLNGETDLVREKITIDNEVQNFEKFNPQYKTDPRYKGLLELQEQANAGLAELDRQKQNLVDKMSVAHKGKFLEKIVQWEQQKAIIEKGGSPATIDASFRAIEKLRQDINGILSGYPSEIGYYFLKPEEQSKYKGEAAKALQDQYKDDQTYVITNAEIDAKAAKLFLEDIENENVLEFEPVAQMRGNYFASSWEYYETNTTDQEVEEYDFLNDIKQFRQADLFSTTAPTDSRSKLQKQKPGDVPIDDIGIDAEQNYDIARRDDFLSRLQKLQESSDFYQSMSIDNKKIIKDFMNDIKSGRRPRFGRVEPIIRAEEIAYDLKAQNQNPIKVFRDFQMPEFDWNNPLGFIKSIASETMPYLTTAGQKMQTGYWGNFTKVLGGDLNMMTGDIFHQAIFRNQEAGKPFISLYQQALQNQAIAENKVGEYQQQGIAKWNMMVDSYNATKPAGAPRMTRIEGGLRQNRISAEEDYEMQVLAMLRRRIGEPIPPQAETAKTGMVGKPRKADAEFERQKNVLYKELQLRKEEMERDPKDTSAKRRYDVLKQTLDNLGVESAVTYEQVAANARQPIRESVDFLASLFPHDAAKQRNIDYDANETFYEKGSYMPTFRETNDGETVLDGVRSNVGVKKAGALEDVTDDDQLATSRLSFGNYFMRAYDALSAVEIDISSRSDWETLTHLVNSKQFESLFQDKTEYDMVQKYYGSRLDVWKQMLVNSHGDSDIEMINVGTVTASIFNAVYSGLASTSLSGVTQPSSQFFGAVTGVMPMITDPSAKGHLYKGMGRFMIGLAEAGNGNKKNSALAQNLSEMLFGGRNLQNIYDKSRTQGRSALFSNFQLKPGDRKPLSYYTEAFNLKGDIVDQLRKNGKDNVMYTGREFIDFVGKTSELSLELFLANADRVAANLSFESHYMQARSDQGARIPKTQKARAEWWAKENENPNMEAIQYADQRIGETMRQTQSTSEAEFYGATDDQSVKNARSVLYAYGKFQVNAKTNATNQIMRLYDKTLPETERSEAQKRLFGLVNEIVTFSGIKHVADNVMFYGLAGAAITAGMDSDDIDKFGGLDELITVTMLPINDPKVKSILDDKTPDQVATLEALRMQAREYSSPLDESLLEAYNAVTWFEQKMQAKGGHREVAQAVATDLFSNLNPFPGPSESWDLAYYFANKASGEQMFTEYISSDLQTWQNSVDDRVIAGINNAGILSVGVQQARNTMRAYQIRDDKMIIKPLTGGAGDPIVHFVRAENPIMQKKLDAAADLLVYLRRFNTMNIFNKKDVNRVANVLERNIERYFTVAVPNIENIDGLFYQAYREKRVQQGAVIDPHNEQKWWDNERRNWNIQARDHALDMQLQAQKQAAGIR